MDKLIKDSITSSIDEVIEHRRYLHMHPELSGKEFQTQKYIKEVLNKHQIKFVEAANTGLLATIDSGRAGKCIAIRADIDALPIEETNDVKYKSVNPGIMHACGHDAHTAILIGIAISLKELRHSFDGSVKLIFQPDEEENGAAKRIVEEGFLHGVDVVLGLHVMPHYEVGTIEVSYGVLNAQSDSVIIDVYGKSAHGAYPELGIDALVISGHLIVQLQSIISRMISPLEAAVLTFGIINGGSRPNIICDHVQIRGTLRTVSKESREYIKSKIQEMSENVATSMGGSSHVTFFEGYPFLINNPLITSQIVSNANEMESIHTIIEKKKPSMGVEDFGYYLKETSGAFFHIGCGNKSRGICSGLHTKSFDIDEDCLALGIELQVGNVLSLLKGV